MTEKEKMKSMIGYIRQLKSGILKVDRVRICDDIKIQRYTSTKDGNTYIKVLIKLPREE